MLEKIIAAILAFLFKKAADEVAIAQQEKKIEDGGKNAIETKDTSSLEDALSHD